MKLIKLTQGYFALVDDIDYDYLIKWKWHIHKNKNRKRMYAARFARKHEWYTNHKHVIFMHQEIAKRMELIGSPDHKDRNGLNNQRKNLREATNSQQAANRSKHKDSKNKYKGVHKHAPYKYEAHIMCNGKNEYLGIFTTEEMAAQVRDYFAIKYFGEFAVLNFPESKELYKF